MKKDSIDTQTTPENTSTPIDTGAIDALIDSAKQDSGDVSRTLMQPKVQTKRGGARPGAGRKSKEAQNQNSHESFDPQPTIQVPPTAPTLKILFMSLSSGLVASTGSKAAALHAEEIESLSQAWGAVCDQYAPQIMSKHGPLIVAGLATAGVAMRVTSSIESDLKQKREMMIQNRNQAQADQPYNGVRSV